MLNEIKQDVQDSGGLLELRLFPQAAYATLFVQAVQGPAILLHKVAQKYTARQLWAPLSAALELLYQLASGNFKKLPEGLRTLLSLGLVLVVLIATELIQKPAKIPSVWAASEYIVLWPLLMWTAVQPLV